MRDTPVLTIVMLGDSIWNDYEKHVKNVNPLTYKNTELNHSVI